MFFHNPLEALLSCRRQFRGLPSSASLQDARGAGADFDEGPRAERSCGVPPVGLGLRFRMVIFIGKKNGAFLGCNGGFWMVIGL